MEHDSNHSPASSQILIADDDALAAKAFQRMLAAEGRAVNVAGRLADAVGLLRTQKFDALLVDIFLGQDDGIALLELSKTLQPDTLVILITGKPMVENASAAVRLKAYDYLSKPISRDRLCHTVAKALEIKQLRSAKKKIELENRRYQHDLEALVTARTEKLVQSNLRYQLLFENSKDAIFMASRDGQFLALNEAAVQLFGYERAELLRVRAAPLWSDAGEYERYRREIETSGFVKDFAVRFTKKDGMILDCLLTANLLHHPEGYMAAPCSWTRSARCPPICNLNYWAHWTTSTSGAWAAGPSIPCMYALSRPPTPIWPMPCANGASEKIFTTVSA